MDRMEVDGPSPSPSPGPSPGPSGTKRKAGDDASPDARPARRIKVRPPRRREPGGWLTTTVPPLVQALDATVVNKIAAGEIIVAPVHALKELIENAVDAGSTAIDIVVKDGGLKQLQITDNGGGIQVRAASSFPRPHLDNR